MLFPPPSETLMSEPLVNELFVRSNTKLSVNRPNVIGVVGVGLNEFPNVPEAGGVTETIVVGERTSGAALAVAEVKSTAAATDKMNLRNVASTMSTSLAKSGVHIAFTSRETVEK